jgi:putative glutamine amidotransferase
MLNSALDDEIPVLGICRGLHLINVAMGGTLHQHIPEHVLVGEAAPTERHGLEIVPDSVLARLYPDAIQINSLHHQTIDRLGDDLRITAHADIDRTIEGIEHLRKPVVAVQWHPEYLASCPADPIFRWLVDEASSAY